ncbi:hypothetical protein [Labrys monachus]|uniref:Uncharacterized protein n=1 Tax=Labrys monachus TaxID=217067 RepID=A0ABU0FH11_9HYPH|nr:hypothetical protein [Labrys monachus]MDQ0393893.1 hypothetical protein [Labrys monachus]
MDLILIIFQIVTVCFSLIDSFGAAILFRRGTPPFLLAGTAHHHEGKIADGESDGPGVPASTEGAGPTQPWKTR